MMEDQTETIDDSQDVAEGRIQDESPEGSDLKSDPQNESSTESRKDSDDEPQNDPSEDEPDTFSRDYVEKLRDENAKYRQRAQRADDLARKVHRLLVERTGRLADPEDLPFDEKFLDDEESLNTAIEDLVSRKPHLAARRPVGNVGQGVGDGSNVDLAAILRNAAS